MFPTRSSRQLRLEAMKRAAALVSLSRDHHKTLLAARQLKRATAETARDARASFLVYWDRHGSAHFRLEDEVLLPAFAAHGDAYHPLVCRALCDHVAIRERINALDREEPPTLTVLHQLGSRLAEHVRLEERELFPLIEQTMPASQLAAVAAALARSE
jgi:hypothetical protein